MGVFCYACGDKFVSAFRLLSHLRSSAAIECLKKYLADGLVFMGCYKGTFYYHKQAGGDWWVYALSVKLEEVSIVAKYRYKKDAAKLVKSSL